MYITPHIEPNGIPLPIEQRQRWLLPRTTNPTIFLDQSNSNTDVYYPAQQTRFFFPRKTNRRCGFNRPDKPILMVFHGVLPKKQKLIDTWCLVCFAFSQQIRPKPCTPYDQHTGITCLMFIPNKLRTAYLYLVSVVCYTARRTISDIPYQ